MEERQMSDFFNDQKRQVVGELNLLNINDCKDIHMATLQVLEKTGVFVEDQQARELYGSCGARIDEKNSIVKLPSTMVEDAIRSAPAQVMLAGRTPDRNVLLENTANAYLTAAALTSWIRILVQRDNPQKRTLPPAPVCATL
jgi:trimethylamine:corrinoid methyltransferase-like protein